MARTVPEAESLFVGMKQLYSAMGQRGEKSRRLRHGHSGFAVHRMFVGDKAWTDADIAQRTETTTL
ncbi:hypothetical protein EMIT0196P_30489 [Pseudomonas chlororaphis]|nr:hypothetical protein C4K17_3912 [Pseudomonas chlororaphis subsp. aurantiaca]